MKKIKQVINVKINADKVKPFVKWAGGKRQLIPIISEKLPLELKKGEIKRYVEPFVGGGAILFYLVQNYEFEEIIINDINEDLINAYKIIKYNVHELIDYLKELSNEYLGLCIDERKKYYYNIRDKFNNGNLSKVEKAAYFIFLNKTCFNGLYRVNKKGKFNVPHGRYKNPCILDKENLMSVSEVLKNVKIINGDFEKVEKYIDENTFVYLDPPYRPLSTSSSFTAYQKSDFNDDEQVRLAEFYDKLDLKGAKLMLSNSDPKNANVEDNFFDNLYECNKKNPNKHYNILRVDAKRSINSKANKRGKIKELLIINY